MPRPGMLWRHVIINTLRTWLHGDARGFRSRKHRIHSSGDYRNPPPPGKHAGLFRYHEQRSGEEVTIPEHLRKPIGMAIVAYLVVQGYRVLSVAVSKVHAHFVVELPADHPTVKRIVGEAKRQSSRAAKAELPGHVWAEGGTYKPVETRGHLEAAYEYVLYDQGRDAWTWSYRDRSDEGCFGRKRPPGDDKGKSSTRNDRGRLDRAETPNGPNGPKVSEVPTVSTDPGRRSLVTSLRFSPAWGEALPRKGAQPRRKDRSQHTERRP